MYILFKMLLLVYFSVYSCFAVPFQPLVLPTDGVLERRVVPRVPLRLPDRHLLGHVHNAQPLLARLPSTLVHVDCGYDHHQCGPLLAHY